MKSFLVYDQVFLRIWSLEYIIHFRAWINYASPSTSKSKIKLILRQKINIAGNYKALWLKKKNV